MSNSRSPRPIPLPVYNACHYPLFDGKARYQSLRQIAESLSVFDTADPLRFYLQFDPKASLFTATAAASISDFSWIEILNAEAHVVSAYRLYAGSPGEDRPAELDCEARLLQSTPDRGYLYSCHWWGSGVRFTYVDREGGFTSAQTFDPRKDPALCAFNIGLMLNIPADKNLYDTRIAYRSFRTGQVSAKRLRLDVSSELPATGGKVKHHENEPTPFAGSEDGNIQWFVVSDLEPSGGFYKLAWEVCCEDEQDGTYDGTSHILQALGIPHRHDDLRVRRTLSHLPSFALCLCDIPSHHQARLLLQLVDDLKRPEVHLWYVAAEANHGLGPKSAGHLGRTQV